MLNFQVARGFHHWPDQPRVNCVRCRCSGVHASRLYHLYLKLFCEPPRSVASWRPAYMYLDCAGIVSDPHWNQIPRYKQCCGTRAGAGSGRNQIWIWSEPELLALAEPDGQRSKRV